MPRRQTTGVQRRARASDRALEARVGANTRPAIDVRLLALGGFVVLGVIVLVVVVLVGGGEEPIGQVVPDAGRQHIDQFATPPEGSYTSVPGTSGPHWNAPANWGVYPGAGGGPVAEAQAIHNLEHGGIVIWYQPDRISQASIDELTSFVRGELGTTRFKFILSPWSGEDFGHPVAVTAWTRLLHVACEGAAASSPGATSSPAAAPPEQCDIDMGQVRAFVDRYYGRLGPEPAGGPGAPAG